MFKFLQDELLLEKYFLADEKIAEFKDNGEKHWPMSIQKSWPCFIQGVCETFLNMIASTRCSILESHSMQELPLERAKLESIYKEIETTISGMWQEYGNEVFLHHLNAIFGYVPVVTQASNIGNILIRF
jgi:hypothetical protein